MRISLQSTEFENFTPSEYCEMKYGNCPKSVYIGQCEFKDGQCSFELEVPSYMGTLSGVDEEQKQSW